MSLPADAGYSGAATEGHTYTRQLLVGDVATGVILGEVKMDPASALQVGSGLIRRSGTLVISNQNGNAPSSDGLIGFGRYFLVRFGIRQADGSTLTCDQPWLFPDSFANDMANMTVTIAVSDGMRIVSADATLGAALFFPDGSPLEEVVRSILVACGASDDDGNFDLDAGGAHLNGDHGYEVGSYFAQIFDQLQQDYAIDIWAAPPNVYTLRPIPDPTTATPVATWQLGRAVRMIGLTETWVSLARNHAIVDGLDQWGNPFTQEAFDLNPDSPVRYGAPGVGDLVVRVRSDGITTPAQALEVAQSLLVTRGVQRSFDASVPIDASLDRRDVVRIVNPYTSTDSLAMLDGFPLPLAPGSQQISVIEARSLS
jgi:hypothetical protein